MHIHCLGLNHRTANVALRECLAYTPARLAASLARMGSGTEPVLEAIREMVILSTCNRVEIYAVASGLTFTPIEKFLSLTRNAPIEDYSPALYRYHGDEVVRHLFHVAAGLDSQVLGETQILGQVSEAYSIAREHGTAGKILSRLFQAAIHAGKRVHTETAINQNPGTVASVAVNLIAKHVPDLPEARVTVLGAGQMAEEAIEALLNRGLSHIRIVNRTFDHARQLAERWGAQTDTLAALPEVLAATDVLIASTGAPHSVVHPAAVQTAMRHRSNRSLIIVDIAVPRDVDPMVADIPGVQLYDIDQLTDRLEFSREKRHIDLARVEEILLEEHAEFMQYLAMQDVVPIIARMRQLADDIRQAELEKTVRRIPDLPPETLADIDMLTKSIVKKLLHTPTIRLREEATGSNASDYAFVARDLFGIE